MQIIDAASSSFACEVHPAESEKQFLHDAVNARHEWCARCE